MFKRVDAKDKPADFYSKYRLARKQAQQTKEILETGYYQLSDTLTVSVKEEIDNCIQDTHYYPNPIDNCIQDTHYYPNPSTMICFNSDTNFHTKIKVIDQTSVQAALENDKYAVLNFASGTSPGGGWLGGALTQEEELARCSALYSGLISKPEYYDRNKCLEFVSYPGFPKAYSDGIIFSKHVPFFRNHLGILQDKLSFNSILTCPAPNWNGLSDAEWDKLDDSLINKLLENRIDNILKIFLYHQETNLILGAWGCGVYDNNPYIVAKIFKNKFETTYKGRFQNIIFAIPDVNSENYKIFNGYFS